VLAKDRPTRVIRPTVSSVCLSLAKLAEEALADGDVAAAVWHVEQAYAVGDIALGRWERDQLSPKLAAGLPAAA
jgi:hypothetical protein